MNTFYRVVSGAAAICIGIGVLLGGIGVLLGGRVSELPARSLGLGFGLLPRVWGSETVEASYTGVRSLDFEFEAMDVEIREGDGDSFQIRASRVNKRRFITRQDGDTWEIRCDNRYHNRWPNIGNRWEKKAPRVVITVPKGFAAEDLKLSLEMGNLTIRDLDAQDLELRLAMGNLSAQGLAAHSSDIDLEMGEMILSDFSSGDIELDVGMGSLIFDGQLTGRGKISCGMGSIEMILKGKESDYGFDATVGMGSVEIGTRSASGLGGAMTLNNTAENFFEVDCGMGSIEIGFTNR